jgi:hypothetical protein
MEKVSSVFGRAFLLFVSVVVLVGGFHAPRAFRAFQDLLAFVLAPSSRGLIDLPALVNAAVPI